MKPAPANTSSQARQEAIRNLPLSKLQPQVRAQVQTVLNQSTMYRRMPVQSLGCDHDLYQFLMQRPDVVVNMWESLNMSKVTLKPNGPGKFIGEDHAGTTCQVEIVYDSKTTKVIFAEGNYTGPLFKKPVQGQCVLLIRSQFDREEDQSPRVLCQVDMFLKLDHAGVDLLAKTLKPFLGRLADYNFLEAVTFIERVHQTSEVNPQGMQRLAKKLRHVEPPVRDELADICREISRDAASRLQPSRPAAATAGSPAPRPSATKPR